MNNEHKISRLSIVCVLCATAFSSAYGASTVRTLGGAGTYSSASAASASGSNSGVARAGAVRVTPSAGRAVATAKPSGSTTSSSAASRVSAAPRLSLGKYLGGTTINRPNTGGNSGGSNPGFNATDIADLQQQISAIRADLDKAQNAVEKLDGAISNIVVQGVATDGYIGLDNNGMAYLDVNKLGADSKAEVVDNILYITLGKDGGVIDVNLPDLLSSDDMNAKLEERLNDYVTKTEFEKSQTDIKNLTDTVNALNTDGTKLTEALTGKADKLISGNYTEGHVATVGANGQYVDGGVLLDSLATNTDLADLATKMGAVNDSGQVVNRFETLKEEINNNMTTMLKNDLTFTEVGADGKLVIKENSITAREIAPESITNVELAKNTVKEENLATEITKQLIGDGYADVANATGNNSGVAVMLVDGDGNKTWVPLELADATTDTPSDTGGGN